MPQLPVGGKSELAGPHQSIKLVEYTGINFCLRKQRKSLEEAKLLLLISNKEELVENSEREGSLF